MTIYGPRSRTKDDATGFKSQTWYVQKPIDHSMPLTYDMEARGPLPGNNIANSWSSWSYSMDHANFSQVIAKTRDRFNNAIGSNASLGVTLAEWKQSFDMITKRGMQLFQFARALRKGRFGDAWAALGDRALSRPPPRGLRRGKSFANNFLEWHFGWSPLVKDIGDSIDVLQGPCPANPVRARAKLRFEEYQQLRWDSTVHWDNRKTWTLRVAMGAEIYVSNPNLYLANKLGFVNPAVIAWELVPFSFVVDWFVPVGGFLSQWTDFVGLTLQKPYTTKDSDVQELDHYLLLNPPGVREDKKYRYRHTLNRSLSIASYKLKANRFTGLSPMRGLTAISLVLQKLKG